MSEVPASVVGDALRWAVLNRDGFRCCYCGLRPEGGAVLEVDHVIPQSWGGKSDPRNLRSSCRRCNRGKRDGVAVPFGERSDIRPARGAWPDRFVWLRWGDWCLELSAIDRAWVFLVYRPSWREWPEAWEYYIDRNRFDQDWWVDHISRKVDCVGLLPPPRRTWSLSAAEELAVAFQDLELLGLRKRAGDAVADQERAS
jgi:hypothetical protein